jgi:hypothetical protein
MKNSDKCGEFIIPYKEFICGAQIIYGTSLDPALNGLQDEKQC